MHYDLEYNFSYQKRYYWTITTWDENDEASNSDEAYFETGIKEFKAKWISTGRIYKKERLSADYFKKEFLVESKIKKARLYVSSLGTYSCFINDERLEGVLAPGTSEYNKHLYYQTYDITDYLNKNNKIEFILMDGWYMGKLGYLNEINHFGNQRKLIAQLEIEYENGSKETIITDESFKCCDDGPIRYVDLKDGEIYDSNLIPSYDKNAIVCDETIEPVAAKSSLILEHEEFIPNLIITPSGKKVLDFKQNIAGYISFKVEGKKNQKIKIQMAEVLDHGEFSRNTLIEDGKPDNIKQEIIFICNGSRQEFHPEGFYSGFRYALVEGLDEVNPNDFKAIAIYSDLEFVGRFECSNDKINQFYKNTLWSLKSNFVDVPTDCPQREKSGWDGDAQIFLPTAAFMCDTASFFRKWLIDVKDCQRKDGRVENVSPSVHRFSHREPQGGAAGWADAAIIIPYTLWKIYSDDSFIKDNLDLMLGWKAYVEKSVKNKTLKKLSFIPPLNKMYGPYYVKKSEFEKYVVEAGTHWGEWLEPDVDSISEMNQPKPELATAYASYSMGLLAEMLYQINKDDLAKQCIDFSNNAKKAYNYYFIKDGHTINNRQASLVRPLALNLLDNETAKNVAKDLNEIAISRNYTVGTGFLSTPYILNILVKYGYVDTAYKMLENTKAPGWLAMVESGATTIWETYIMYDENNHPLMHSMNHYSPGSICAFMFNTICGINVVGNNKFLIKPIVGGTLRYAEAEYDSPYGKVSSSWHKEKDNIVYKIKVPANCEAEIILENGNVYEVCAGEYEYKIEL